MISDLINDLMNDYSYTNKFLDPKMLDNGDKVYVAQPDGTGKVYQFMGADASSVEAEHGRLCRQFRPLEGIDGRQRRSDGLCQDPA